MKKFVIGLLLILSMCAFGFTYYYLYGNKELAGEKITDGVYLYDTKVGDYNRSISVYDGNIYSLVEIDKNYELYKYDLYKNENKRIGVVDSLEKFCYIDEEYITCLGDNRTIYDLKLKKLYDVKDRNIIPYKKGFIEAKGNKLYYKEKEYAKLGDDKEYSLSTYYKFDDNIYIVVTNTENGTCLYDFNNKKCKKLDNVAINKYDNGLFMYDDNKIYIDSFDSKDLEYNIPIDREFLYDSKYHNNLLYYFADDYLRIYNLDNDKVRFLDYRINISIYKTFLEDNILFIITSEDKVYAFKLDEVTFSEEQTLDELNKIFNKRIDERIEELEKEYSIEITVRDEASINMKVYKQSTEGEKRIGKLNAALDDTEEVLKRFGKEIFKEFIHDDYTGLRIYIVASIKAEDSLSGYAVRWYDKYTVISDTFDYKRTLYHELMHSMEDNLYAKNKNAFNKWMSLNPKKYNYKGDYSPYALTYEYSVGYFNNKEYYFIDNYSQTNGLEDKARIFENICMNTVDDIKNNPKILKKAEYIRDELLKYFPMLKESNIFDSLN